MKIHDHLPDVVEHPRVGAEVEEVLHDPVVAALAGQVHRRRLLVDRVVLDGVGAGLDKRLNDLKDDIPSKYALSRNASTSISPRGDRGRRHCAAASTCPGQARWRPHPPLAEIFIWT